MVNTRLYNSYIEQANENTPKAEYTDETIKDMDIIILPKYVPLSAGWHLIDIKSFFTRHFANKDALGIVFVLFEDETETEHKQTLWKYQLALLREVKKANLKTKASELAGKIWALFCEQTSEQTNKTYIVIKAFAKEKPEEE